MSDVSSPRVYINDRTGSRYTYIYNSSGENKIGVEKLSEFFKRQNSKLFAFHNLQIKQIQETFENCFEIIANIILKSLTQSIV